MRWESVESEAGLRRLAPEWDALLGSMARPSPFLSWDWVFTWWRQFGARSTLRVVTARARDGRLLGLAPVHIVRRRAAGAVPVRSLEFLGYRGSAVCADHLDFLSRPEARETIVAGLVAELLRQRRDWDVVVLADLAEDSLVPAIWKAARHRFDLAVEKGETCYFLTLPDTVGALWDDVKRHHSGLASNVRYYRKRLEKRYQTQFVAAIAADEISTIMGTLARLHGLSRGRKGETGNFCRDDYRAFQEALAERLAAHAALYLARLECDGRTVAVLYGFVQGETLYFYQSGFDTALSADSIGTLLLARVLEDAVQRLGLREFDFLRGAEPYKLQWTSQARHTRSLRCWQHGFAGRTSQIEWRARRGLAAARARGTVQLARLRRRLAPAHTATEANV